jgi:hypothetical protein
MLLRFWNELIEICTKKFRVASLKKPRTHSSWGIVFPLASEKYSPFETGLRYCNCFINGTNSPDRLWVTSCRLPRSGVFPQSFNRRANICIGRLDGRFGPLFNNTMLSFSPATSLDFNSICCESDRFAIANDPIVFTC